MSEQIEPGAMAHIVHTQDEGFKMIDKLLSASSVDAVYSKPIKSGDTTVILASEVGAGGGFGGGMFGANRQEDKEPRAAGGIGGGGGSSGRPVAAVVIGPEGGSIQPIFDRTKILIALLAAIGSLIMAMGRGRR